MMTYRQTALPRRRVKLLLGVFLVVLGAAAFFVGLVASSAAAYPLRKGSCDALGSVYYNFAGSGWTTTRQANFTNGANDWDSVQSPFGGALTHSGTGGSIEIYIADLGAGAGGVTNCDGFGNLNSITIDPDGLTTNGFIGVSSHEFGHAHGLAHTGPSDSFDGSVATMTAGCGLDYSGHTYDDQRYLEQDDYASLAATFTDNAHANSSFENGFSFWGTGGGESVSIFTSGGTDGPSYARIYGSGGYIYQTVRVTDPADITGRINYKKYYSASSGTVWLGVYGRRIDYPSNAPSYCQYVNGWNLNTPSFPSGTGFVYEKGVTVTPSSSWKDSSTSEWTGVDGWEGADVRVYVYNYMQLEGGSTYVRIDHTRARHT